jgi:hypothetical protein
MFSFSRGHRKLLSPKQDRDDSSFRGGMKPATRANARCVVRIVRSKNHYFLQHPSPVIRLRQHLTVFSRQSTQQLVALYRYGESEYLLSIGVGLHCESELRSASIHPGETRELSRPATEA